MKIAFSTLGCPNWQWSEIISTARDFGYQGIEVRGVKNEIYAPKIKEFSEDKAEETMEKLRSLGLSITCFTAGCILGGGDCIDEGKEYIDLAAKMQVPYVRVLGDEAPQPGEGIDDEKVAEDLKALCEYADKKGVICLVETNGVYSNSDRLKSVIDRVSSPACGVLWDLHHTYRFGGEPCQKTFDTLGKHIRHIHLKDSVLIDGQVQYRMMGEGDIPVVDCLTVLKSADFQGFLSLEWVKRWYSDLEEPGIVFMQFINYINKTLSEI